MSQRLEFPALNSLLLDCSIFHPILAPMSAHMNHIRLSRPSSASLFCDTFYEPPLGSDVSFLWTFTKFNLCLFYDVQRTLEQHGFELHGSTCMWNFFNSKYYSTTRSTVGWIHECRTVDIRDCVCGGLTIDYKWIFFAAQRACNSNPQLFKDQLFFTLFILAVPRGLQDLNSPIRDWTCATCSGSAES